MSNFISPLKQFKKKENLTILWEVLLDELHINTSSKNLVSNIRTVFESNINPFTSRANPKTNIMELNKHFLSQVVLAVNRLFPNIKQENNIKRITISDEEVAEPYRIEDIQASRQSDFEKEVDRKRMEMENYMSPQKPKELDFSYGRLDGKITAMDSLVADKLVQRNIEIEQFQNSNYNNSSIDPEKWLTPKETSVKNDKSSVEPKVAMLEPKVIEQRPIIKNNQNTRLKHIAIDSNNNITLTIDEIQEKSQNPIKKVSWNDINDNKQEPIINIFNKLKKQPIIETNEDNTININNEKQYIEQTSMPLPEIKQEEIVRNQTTTLTSNNEPILPKTEIIKQLNEMNKKIDNLYDIVFKLTTLIQNNKDEVIDKPDVSN